MLHYFDNAATTPVRPEAVAAAVAAMTEGWGNPSSRHRLGGETTAQLNAWRKEVAGALGCEPGEIFFTSCGTESDNWAIFASLEKNRRVGKHIITTAIEHDGVLAPLKELERQGYEVTYLQPDKRGNIAVDQVSEALRPDTALVSMMLVNNEIGSILPVREVAQLLKKTGSRAMLHCDAVQAFLKIKFTPKQLGVDLLSISGHKIHGPKGIGALYIRSGLKLPAMIYGGGQEGGLRSGTEATSQIAAFAAACTAGKASLNSDITHMAELKQYAIAEFSSKVSGVEILNQGGAPHILPISLVGYKSEVVVRFLSDRNICISSGSACHRGKPSHVFGALKLQKPVQDGALRISFSYDTTRDDIDALIAGLQAAAGELFTSLS